jgi:hypothetical protein
LEELAELVNQLQPVTIDRYLAEYFRLDDAGAGVVRLPCGGADNDGGHLSVAPAAEARLALRRRNDCDLVVGCVQRIP